jgi:periplasmic protein TonB
VERIDTRQGFLISALVHLGIIMVLASRPAAGPKTASDAPDPEPARVAQRVFLPPPAVLRQLAPIPPRAERSAPVPTPPPQPRPKDRISIGPPVEARQKGPLILRREDDLTRVAKGRPDAVPQAPTPAPPASATPEPGRQAGVASPGSPGLKLPPGIGDLPKGAEGETGQAGAGRRVIADSLRNLDRKLQTQGTLGLESGTGQQMGPLFFDPQGADFTVWINHFKNEVYRNWIVPQPAQMGLRGHVDIEFSVDRAGNMSGVRIIKSSGTPAFDRAAQNALLGSSLLPLPADFAPATVTMGVSFFYNQGPSDS